MSQIEIIREQWKDGKRVSEIASSLGIDRKTVYKYVGKEDFSEDLKPFIPRGSRLDPYIGDIKKMLEEEKSWFRKQRYTARRIHRILTERYPDLRCSYSNMARVVAELRRKGRNEEGRDSGTMQLTWHPGEAQADFGEADFLFEGVLERTYYLNLSFPNSNRYFTVLAESENCECVCNALLTVFRFIGHVPSRIVFDNATGIGRRVFGRMKEAELFTRFRLHYGFRATYANIRSGWEKGNVENSIGDVRRNLMVPPMEAYRPLDEFNESKMLPLSSQLHKDDIHYRRNTAVGDLFMEDIDAMEALNPREFRIERFDRISLNSTGVARIDARHEYCLGPEHSRETVIVGKCADRVNFYSLEGHLIKQFQRIYGDEATIEYDLEAMLRCLPAKPNSWLNSPVRDAMDDGPFRRLLDASGTKDRSRLLYMLSHNVDEFGFGTSCTAVNMLIDRNGKAPSKDDVHSLSRRLRSFNADSSENPTGVDLSIFDSLIPDLKEAR